MQIIKSVVVNYQVYKNRVKEVLTRHKRKFKYMLYFIVGIIFLHFVTRGPLMRSVVSYKTHQIEKAYGIKIDYSGLRFFSIAGIKIDSVSISQNSLATDTLFYAKNIVVMINAWKMLFLNPDLTELDADMVRFNFVKRDSVSNFDFLFKKGNRVVDSLEVDKPKVVTNYSKLAGRMFSLLFDILPSESTINRLSVNYIANKYSLEVQSEQIRLSDKKFNVLLESKENGASYNLVAQGTLDESKRYISAKVYSQGDSIQGKRKFTIPYLNYKWGAEIKFDTLSFKMNASQGIAEKLMLRGEAAASGITLFHNRISPRNVVLESGNMNYNIKIGKDCFELDSSSVVTINNFQASPYIKFQNLGKWRVTASINEKEFDSDQLFSSLPQGLFGNLEGIKTSGKLSYHFFIDLDFATLDSLKLESVLRPKNFRIRSFGATDFRYINNDFDYTAFENGEAVRIFTVGPSNPNFRTLDRISPLLKTAVLQSEDGGFFYHNGFLIESIKGALIQDIKEGRFRRGGSTISMQLVKNLFLSRHKTLARKFEEILIVWLIETSRLSSKERMFEIYMNIIEWGPMIYGANEASRFYFDKDAKDLTVNEAIFLASIIPSPKRSLNSFTQDFHLKEELAGYYRLLAERLMVKGEITPEEASSIVPDVQISGKAKKILEERKAFIDTTINANEYENN